MMVMYARKCFLILFLLVSVLKLVSNLDCSALYAFVDYLMAVNKNGCGAASPQKSAECVVITFHLASQLQAARPDRHFYQDLRLCT